MATNDTNDRMLRQDTDPALYPSMLAALETKPSPAIPVDFAARMAKMAQTQPVKRPRAQTLYGQRMAWVSLFVLAAVVVVLAPSTMTSGALNTGPIAMMEYLCIAQLLGLALWLGSRSFPGTR